MSRKRVKVDRRVKISIPKSSRARKRMKTLRTKINTVYYLENHVRQFSRQIHSRKIHRNDQMIDPWQKKAHGGSVHSNRGRMSVASDAEPPFPYTTSSCSLNRRPCVPKKCSLSNCASPGDSFAKSSITGDPMANTSCPFIH